MGRALGVAVMLLALTACGEDPSAERISASDASTTATSAPETTTTTVPSTTTSAVATTTTEAPPPTTAALPSILGTWNVVTIRDGSESLTPELDLSVDFDADDSYHTHDGCNAGGGDYAGTGMVLDFREFASTSMGCFSSDDDVQQRRDRELELFLAVIGSGESHWSRSGDTLTLSRASTELVLHRA